MRFSPCYRRSEQLIVLPRAGVTFCLSRGVSDREFEHGLAEWRRRHPVEVAEDAAATGED